MSFASCFCYDLAHSVTERAQFLAVDTSLEHKVISRVNLIKKTRLQFPGVEAVVEVYHLEMHHRKNVFFSCANNLVTRQAPNINYPMPLPLYCL